MYYLPSVDTLWHDPNLHFWKIWTSRSPDRLSNCSFQLTFSEGVVILTDTLRGLLYSRHTLPQFYCRVVVQFPWVVRIIQPSQHPWMLIQNIRSLLENLARALQSTASWNCNCNVTESSKDPSTLLSSQLLQGGGELGETSKLHEHGPIATLTLLWSEFLDQTQWCTWYHDSA